MERFALFVVLVFLYASVLISGGCATPNAQSMNEGEQNKHPKGSNRETNPFYISAEQAERNRKEFIKNLYDRAFQFSDKGGLVRLETSSFPETDREFRIWMTSRENSLIGLIASDKGNVASAYHLLPEKTKLGSVKKNLPKPKSGWAAWWEFLETQEALFEGAKNPLERVDPDTPLFVIEMRVGSKYGRNVFSLSDINGRAEPALNLCDFIYVEIGLRFCD